MCCLVCFLNSGVGPGVELMATEPTEELMTTEPTEATCVEREVLMVHLFLKEADQLITGNLGPFFFF